MAILYVSVHGGHSGGYCGHASDRLVDVVARYYELGFEWVCLTEHMPSPSIAMMAPEESDNGLTVESWRQNFADYMSEARALQVEYAGRMDILVGFETDAYSGYESAVASLIEEHQPDMIVGSVHHVHDQYIDFEKARFEEASRLSGGIEQLYCDYFDKQFELINRFEPAVVGHFDLIRLLDEDYPHRWDVPEIMQRAYRNLDRIRELGLILDLNMRAMKKGASEPYVSEPFMKYAIANDIAMVPGDDAHAVADVGGGFEEGLSVFAARGGSTNWRKPGIGRHVGHRSMA